MSSFLLRNTQTMLENITRNNFRLLLTVRNNFAQPQHMKFANVLAPLVEKVGTGEAARLCGVTPRTLQLWMRGEGNPNLATKRGTLDILRGAAAKKAGK